MNEQEGEIMDFMTKEVIQKLFKNLWKEIMDISLQKNLKILIDGELI